MAHRDTSDKRYYIMSVRGTAAFHDWLNEFSDLWGDTQDA